MSATTEIESPSRRSPVWPIVSRATAAVLGGFIVTYWVGAAFDKAMVVTGALGKADAALTGGLVQLLTYVVVAIWASTRTSIRTTWIVLTIVTAVCVAIVEFTPDFPSPGASVSQARPS